MRANRYGHARAFFFDDWAYPERDGFWTRANGSATVVIDTGEGTRLSGLPITVVAGAVPTTIRLAIGPWEESISLGAGQKQDVVLPPAESGAWTLAHSLGSGLSSVRARPRQSRRAATRGVDCHPLTRPSPAGRLEADADRSDTARHAIVLGIRMSDPSTGSGQATDSALLNRLLAERREAHRRYNEALTELDRAIQPVPDFPASPPAYDETLLPRINETWGLLPKGATPPRPSGQGSPSLRRDLAGHRAALRAANGLQRRGRRASQSQRRQRTGKRMRRSNARFRRCVDGFDALVRFESLLVQFLQTITPLSDTHYREIDDAITQLRAVTDIAQRTAMLAKREVDRRANQEPGTGSREPESEARRCVRRPACVSIRRIRRSLSRIRGRHPRAARRLRVLLRRAIERPRRRVRPG